MNLIKKERYAKKDLERLKKILGIDDQGNVDMKDLSEVAVVKTAKQIKQVRYAKIQMVFLISVYMLLFKNINWTFVFRRKNARRKRRKFSVSCRKWTTKAKTLKWSTRRPAKCTFTIRKRSRINTDRTHRGSSPGRPRGRRGSCYTPESRDSSRPGPRRMSRSEVEF